MTAHAAPLGSARVSRVGFGVAPKQSSLWISFGRQLENVRGKFAIARTRSPTCGTHALPGQ
ncbi:MAG: hypothetical protein DME52_03740 [Verrucomicrobia bacterium]|nr:MAG: hypothetical protein DME52_03740 [Verrucomicrobiota bacterium]PYK48327.1 MAG: hypothetical protein DME51_11725 [Verrucomicrobiota bacterium]